MSTVRRYDASPLSKVERTPQGGLRIQSTLTRTGIFEYRQADGTVRREYRPPEEVFAQAHLDSFRDAPVTVGHPGMVTPANWSEHSVGHVGADVKQDDKFVSGTLVIQRADAVAKIERGDLKELSCGYDVDLDETPGEVDGKRYDAVQRNLRGNHVAMGPVGWGRAGKDVAMRLDSNLNEVAYGAPHAGHPTGAAKLPEMATEDKQPDPQIALLKSENEKLTAQNEVLQARADGLDARVKELEAEAADVARFDAAIETRLALVEVVKSIDPKAETKGKSNRDLKEQVIKARAPKAKFDSKSTDEWVNAAYEMALSFEAPVAPAKSLGQVRVDAQSATTAENPVSKAQDKNRNDSINAWKQPLRVVNQ